MCKTLTDGSLFIELDLFESILLRIITFNYKHLTLFFAKTTCRIIRLRFTVDLNVDSLLIQYTNPYILFIDLAIYIFAILFFHSQWWRAAILYSKLHT